MLGWRLDLMVLEVYSNLNDSMTLSSPCFLAPQCIYASCFPAPKARLWFAPSIAYLIFRAMFLWTSSLLVLQPLFLPCRFYFSHVFSCALFVQLYHNSLFALVWLYIIYVLNLTVRRRASALFCWLCLLQCSC